MVYWLILQFAVNMMSDAGMVDGIDVLHPMNVWPVLVGSAGEDTTVPKSCVIGDTEEPPAVSKDIVY